MSKAIIFGASGLVGNHLLYCLLNDTTYHQVISIGRRKLEVEHPKLKQFTADLLNSSTYKKHMTGDHVFICTGTTIKKAGSKKAFRKVDVEMPITIAELAKKNGSSKLAFISSVGANPKSNIFYSRCKGEVEEVIKELNFDVSYAFRPSFLVGKRSEKRLGERIGIRLSLLVKPFLPNKYKPIEASTIAKAMVCSLNSPQGGHHVVHYRKLKGLAKKNEK